MKGEQEQQQRINPVEEFGKQLEAAGFAKHGQETMISGITGQEMPCDIYIGLVYYQRLRHMVSDKFQVGCGLGCFHFDSEANMLYAADSNPQFCYPAMQSTFCWLPYPCCTKPYSHCEACRHNASVTCSFVSNSNVVTFCYFLQVRSLGPINQLTHQPIKGRKLGGGIRFGEMERDSLLAHGAAYLLHDRLHTCSDYHVMDVCTRCGSILAPLSKAQAIRGLSTGIMSGVQVSVVKVNK
jgi:hypothetical protein